VFQVLPSGEGRGGGGRNGMFRFTWADMAKGEKVKATVERHSLNGGFRDSSGLPGQGSRMMSTLVWLVKISHS